MPVERPVRKSARTTVYKNQGKSRTSEITIQRVAAPPEVAEDSSASSTDMPDGVDSDMDLSSAPPSPTVADAVITESMPETGVTDANAAPDGSTANTHAGNTTTIEGPVAGVGDNADGEPLLQNSHDVEVNGLTPPGTAAAIASKDGGSDSDHDNGTGHDDIANMGVEGGESTNVADNHAHVHNAAATVPTEGVAGPPQAAGLGLNDQAATDDAAATVPVDGDGGALHAAGPGPNVPAPVAATGHPQFPKLGHIDFAKLADWVRIATNVDLNAAVYAVGRIPANATWGTQLNNDTFLVDDRGIIISLLAILRVEMTFFQTRGGAYAERVVIKGDTVFEGDAQAINALLGRANGVVPPNGPTNADREFYVRRFQSTIGRGGQKIILPFTEVYDAEGGLTHRDQMQKVGANQIAQDDIILVECRLRRYRSSSSGKSGPWMDWGVNLDLEAAFILHREPVPLRHIGGRPAFNGIIN